MKHQPPPSHNVESSSVFPLFDPAIHTRLVATTLSGVVNNILFQKLRVLGVLARPGESAEVAEITMHRLTLVAPFYIQVHDFPDLQGLFKGQGEIRRWATPNLLIFSSRSLAFILPCEDIKGSTNSAVRSLTQKELDDPIEQFFDIIW